jgi:hypothetical protein
MRKNPDAQGRPGFEAALADSVFFAAFCADLTTKAAMSYPTAGVCSTRGALAVMLTSSSEAGFPSRVSHQVTLKLPG